MLNADIGCSVSVQYTFYDLSIIIMRRIFAL